MHSKQLWFAALVIATFAACSSNTSSGATCSALGIPVPAPQPALAYPIPGAKNVPVDLGEVIFSGGSVLGTLFVRSPLGPIPLGSPAEAPSPLPTPYATPSNSSGYVGYFAVSVPTLSPATKYSVSVSYTGYSGLPPGCGDTVTFPLGSFTTQ